MRLKPLLPTLKERARYVVYEVEGAVHDQKDIVSRCAAHLGVMQGAKAGIVPVASKGQRGILRVNHDMLDEVRFALFLIDTQHNTHKQHSEKEPPAPMRVRTVSVSGLLNKAQEMLDTNA